MQAELKLYLFKISKKELKNQLDTQVLTEDTYK